MQMFRNLPVSRKFLAAFGMVCALCALLGTIALTGMYRINQSTSNLAEIALPSAQNLAQMESAIQIYRRADMGILLCDSPDCTQYYLKTRGRVTAQFQAAEAAYLAAGTNADERASLEAASADFGRYREASDQTMVLLQAAQLAEASKQTVGANALIFRQADAELTRTIESNTQASRQRCLDAAATYTSVRTMVLLMIAFTVLLSGIIGWLLTGAIAPPLVRAAAVLEAMAAKDLTATMTVESSDEIGRMAVALNSAVATLRALLGSMQRGVETISSAAIELSTSADKSSANAQRQSSETNQIASASQEMAATISEVSENAERANVASREAAQSAKDGGAAIRRTTDRMQGISEFTDRTVDKMGTLAKRSEQIGAVVTTIRDISEQTNLLALNAAIEAQRAGEHGRGFAVVAGEVRRLAERTKSATEEISGTIAAIQSETRQTLTLMETGRSGVAEGLAESENAQRTLDAIIAISHRSEDQIAMIAAASTEQAAASAEISRSLANICEISNHVSAGAEETTQASHELSKLAVDLEHEIKSFHLGDEPGHATYRPTRLLVAAAH